ncbi:hypothetical protein GCM10009836_63780 [Pseudonocardia ailaonensis]|uniref:Uncharacterized protein n=1 Tax=Pseudonocardia ailaonensis TaxID=367279 RepID=A0ABN2NQ90_9PSEU
MARLGVIPLARRASARAVTSASTRSATGLPGSIRAVMASLVERGPRRSTPADVGSPMVVAILFVPPVALVGSLVATTALELALG